MAKKATKKATTRKPASLVEQNVRLHHHELKRLHRFQRDVAHLAKRIQRQHAAMLAELRVLHTYLGTRLDTPAAGE